MARKLVVEIIGDASSLNRSYATAARSTKKFGNEVERAGKGAIAGTLAFKGLGRSIAFAGGTFVAFESVTRFLTTSIDAAREAGVAQRALAAQMRATGDSFAENRDRIEQVANSYARFGFENDKVIESLTVLERGTQNINDAIRLQGLTADIARAKNIDLAAAANVVAKVFGGQETALRRAVPGLEKNAHGWDLIREAQQRLRGQAAANTTVAERFNATLHDSEEIIGTALLPILNRYLGHLADWLDKMNRTGQLQKQINQLVKDATPIFRTAGTAIGLAAAALGKYEGFLEKLRAGSKSANSLTRGFSDVIRVLVDPGYGLGKASELANHLADALGLVSQNAKKATSALGGLTGPIGAKVPALAGAPASGLEGPTGTPGKVDVTGARSRQRAAILRRNQIFDTRISRLLDRVQDIKTLRGQIAQLRVIAGLVQQRIDATKDLTRKNTLGDTLAQINRQIVDDQGQIAQKAADAAAKAREKEKEAAKREREFAAAALERARAFIKATNARARAERRMYETLIKQRGAARTAARRAAAQADVFRILGLTATGEERAPSRGNLLAGIAKAQAAVQGTALDTKQLESRFTKLRNVLNSEFGKLTRDTKIRIGEWLDALAGKDKGAGPFTKGHGLDLSSITRGLSREQAKIVQHRLAAQHIVVETPVYLDGREITRSVTSHQVKRNQREPTQVRGKQTR